ncbi:MAG: hypothetical protein E7Z99_05480 [Coriobacteriaceae bacterium]|nr:hypothetical protein [Coriobacteriaceae bacterium]
MREIRISDVTMRRAAGLKELSLTFKEKLEMAKLLDHLGVSAIEVEGIENPKADSLRIKSLASLVRNSVLAVPVQMDVENIDMVWEALKEAAHPRLIVKAAVSPARMEYVHHKKADAMIEDIAMAVSECKKRADEVDFIANDATRADGAYLRKVVSRAIEAGATTVTICDAAGTMLPDEFAEFIRSLKADVPELADVTLGISCSDELYMADACAIAAIIEGVGEVKATTYPMDVVSLGRLSKILKDKADACQATSTVRTTELKRAIAQVSWICESGRSPYSPFETGVREADEAIVLTERDDQDAVMQCVARLGYDLSPEDQAAVYEAFQRVASKKESVGSRELDAIVASAALQVPATYKLESYVINSGNRIKATANICIRKGDEELQAVSVGDGPIDAAFLAIEQIAGQHYELDDFQINSVTQGQEAMGETVVKLVWENKVYSGRGISTDIIGSGIRAYVNALNKIVYEEQN